MFAGFKEPELAAPVRFFVGEMALLTHGRRQLDVGSLGYRRVLEWGLWISNASGALPPCQSRNRPISGSSTASQPYRRRAATFPGHPYQQVLGASATIIEFRSRFRVFRREPSWHPPALLAEGCGIGVNASAGANSPGFLGGMSGPKAKPLPHMYRIGGTSCCGQKHWP